jgi:hypothetical protein
MDILYCIDGFGEFYHNQFLSFSDMIIRKIHKVETNLVVYHDLVTGICCCRDNCGCAKHVVCD